MTFEQTHFRVGGAPSVKESKQPRFDKAFVLRLRTGDPDAEQQFYTHFSRVVLLMLRHLVRRQELIEDIRQTTLLRVCEFLRSGKPLNRDENLPAFVHGVAKNVMREVIRKYEPEVQSPENAPEQADRRPDPEGEFARDEMRKIVLEILETLSPLHQQVLVMVYLDEVDREEVCRRLRIRRGNLNTVLFRARVQFARQLKRKNRGKKL